MRSLFGGPQSKPLVRRFPMKTRLVVFVPLCMGSGAVRVAHFPGRVEVLEPAGFPSTGVVRDGKSRWWAPVQTGRGKGYYSGNDIPALSL